MIEVPLEFIELVVLERRQQFLAQRFGVTDRTIRRWMRDPQVALLIAERREEVQGEIVGRLTDLVDNAFDVLDGLLGEGPAPVQLRAVKLVLEQIGSAHRELADRQADTYEARIIAATPSEDPRVPTGQESAR